MFRNRRVEDFWCGCFLEGEGGGGAGGGSGSDGGADKGGGKDGAGKDDVDDTGKDGKGDDPAELRREAAKYRRELRDTQAELKKLRDEKLTDSEKRDQRLKELENENTSLKQAQRSAKIEAAAARAGARDPDLIAHLIPADAEDVTKAIADIKKNRPHLFGGAGNGSADGGAGGGGRGSGTSMNDLIRRGR